MSEILGEGLEHRDSRLRRWGKDLLAAYTFSMSRGMPPLEYLPEGNGMDIEPKATHGLRLAVAERIQREGERETKRRDMSDLGIRQPET